MKINTTSLGAKEKTTIRYALAHLLIAEDPLKRQQAIMSAFGENALDDDEISALMNRLGLIGEGYRKACHFIKDLAGEELPHCHVGTGAEVALRHILRRATEVIEKNGAL